jgi:hypothetical protein
MSRTVDCPPPHAPARPRPEGRTPVPGAAAGAR